MGGSDDEVDCSGGEGRITSAHQLFGSLAFSVAIDYLLAAIREQVEYTCGAEKSPHVRGLPLHLAEGVQLGQVAIYSRVSTDDQSCARQERDLRAFAKRSWHKIAAVFKETVSGAEDDRPERKKVMALAQAREINAILVTELSRWGRSTQDLVFAPHHKRQIRDETGTAGHPDIGRGFDPCNRAGRAASSVS